MKKNILTGKKKDAIFCALMLVYPLIHFTVFYIVVNASSLAMAFQYYKDGQYIFDWGKSNFDKLFYSLKHETVLSDSVVNSTILYLCSMLIGEPLTLLFSFFIYKKVKGSKFFKVILFLPTIISSLVLVLIFSYFVDQALPEIMGKIFGVETVGLLTTNKTQFITVLVYSLFMGFGPKVLIYSSTMSGINESVVESASLDGITFFGEFIYITLPMIFSTIQTYIVAGLATFFTNQMNLFSFFGTEAMTNLYTLGYYLYVQTQIATANGSFAMYPYLSLLGLLMSCIAIPVTILVKKLLDRYGPSEG